MSVEILENLKEQTVKLTSQEKRLLAKHLVESADQTNRNDLGFLQVVK